MILPKDPGAVDCIEVRNQEKRIEELKSDPVPEARRDPGKIMKTWTDPVPASVSYLGSGIVAETAIGVRLRDVSFAILYGSLGVYLAITFFTRCSLNERGIIVHGHLSAWENIRGFHWDERTPNVVVLERKTRFPLRPTLALPIPSENREAVTELLTRKV